MTRPVDDIANRYVDDYALLSPMLATFIGISDYDDRLDDLSPEGYAARAEAARQALTQLNATTPTDERERVAQEAMQERLGLELALYESGRTTSDVNVIASALHDGRMVFDIMRTEGEQAVANISARLAAFSEALEQYRATLLDSASKGEVSARHQMVEVAKQCDSWTNPDGDDFFRALARRLDAEGALRHELDRAAEVATQATARFGRFLREELAPKGREKQAVGREPYKLASQYFLGAEIDLDETYAWGFEELHRLETEMRAVSSKITGTDGASIDEGVAALDADPARKITGKEPFREWMQALADRTIAELNGSHFDIPEQIQRIECMLAPTSHGGIYYTQPTEDFSRPGRMWWAVPQGIDDFSTWREVTTVYHEGTPGHHLQIGQMVYIADLLNRWQRMMCFCSGHAEGWALYAERLMEDLGYLDDPGDRLGMLDAQAFRAARVVVDIGMHLELEVPVDNPFGFHPGQRWTPDMGWEFMRAHCRVPDEILRFELNRYLGWPGQAPSYKVGERIWLDARDEAKARKGADFDLKTFHQQALDLGALGLDSLKAALVRL